MFLIKSWTGALPLWHHTINSELLIWCLWFQLLCCAAGGISHPEGDVNHITPVCEQNSVQEASGLPLSSIDISALWLRAEHVLFNYLHPPPLNYLCASTTIATSLHNATALTILLVCFCEEKSKWPHRVYGLWTFPFPEISSFNSAGCLMLSDKNIRIFMTLQLCITKIISKM